MRTMIPSQAKNAKQYSQVGYVGTSSGESPDGARPEGNGLPLLVDAHGRLITSPLSGGGGGASGSAYGEYNAGAADVFVVQAFSASGAGAVAQISTVESQLHVLSCVQPEGQAWEGYLHVFDAAAVPADGATPVFRIQVRDGAQVNWEPRYFVCYNGICVAASSTAALYTAAPAGLFLASATWEATS